MTAERPGFATRAIHVGQGPDVATGAVVQPIHLATTFAQEGIGRHGGYEYTRSNNPTREQLETCLASLESGTHGLAFASGLAATATAMLLLDPGDHVVYTEDAYGGTYRLFDKVMRRYGLSFSGVDASQPGAIEAAITDRTRLIWIESPTNPLMRVVDIAAAAEVAHRHGASLAVDSTFATPYIQRPLELGADIVMHSSTKYLGGHSDVLGGCLITSQDRLADRLRFHQNAVGAVPSPFDCWLLLRGLKTLALRVRKHSDNALAVARHLETHPAVRAVHYPGLEAHPQHQLALRQMGGVFGGMVSFELADEATAVRVLEALRLFTLAESLGAVESLAEHPSLMTHTSMPPEERRRIGLGDELLRLSVGIEDLDDLLADLDQALQQAG
ncbi:MAG TPA: cystathionine gamma-synthase [Candidatus Dormibacteraeota bacterium]|jgi:cystathionine beta-lyase/cystathionine gamma-synthase